MCHPGRPRPHGLSHPGSLGVGRLPQHEIGRVALVGRDLDPSAGDHVVAAAPRELPVIGVGGDREQHMAFGRIGVPAGDQPFDHRDHLRDILGRPRLDIGRQGAERRHILVKSRRRPRRQGRDRLVILAGGGVDLVFDVRDVANIAPRDRARRCRATADRAHRRRQLPGRCRYARDHKRSARRHRDAPARDRAARRAPCGASACCKGSAAWLRRSRLRPAGPRDRTPRATTQSLICHNQNVRRLLRSAAPAAGLQRGFSLS